MTFSLFGILGHMGVPAMVVGVILMIMGLASLTVFVERLMTLRRSRAASRAFAAESSDHMREELVEQLIDEAGKHPQGHLPRMVRAGLVTYRHARDTADVSALSPAERTRRH